MKIRHIHHALVAGVAIALGACSSSPTEAPAPGAAFSVAGEKTVGASLVQRVRLSTNRPARGDTLVVRSVITNQGTSPATIEHTVCGFDYNRSDVLQSPFIMCMAYSATTTLAPRDSIVHEDRRVVSARPGRYTIGVTHLVQPRTTVDVTLDVR
jgi:hypothetical protein